MMHCEASNCVGPRVGPAPNPLEPRATGGTNVRSLREREDGLQAEPIAHIIDACEHCCDE